MLKRTNFDSVDIKILNVVTTLVLNSYFRLCLLSFFEFKTIINAIFLGGGGG